jgi:hypothetical protein
MSDFKPHQNRKSLRLPNYEYTQEGAYFITILTVNRERSVEFTKTSRALHYTKLNYEQFGKPISGSIPTIIRSFKSEVTRRVNILRHTPGAKLWQRNYYEHVIRNEKDFQALLEYIHLNPIKWGSDD